MVGGILVVLALGGIRQHPACPRVRAGVVLRLGRLIAPRGPGLFLTYPGVDHVTMVDRRVITHEVPPREVITSDNVTVKVSDVIFFQGLDAQAAIVRVRNDHLTETVSLAEQRRLFQERWGAAHGRVGAIRQVTPLADAPHRPTAFPILTLPDDTPP